MAKLHHKLILHLFLDFILFLEFCGFDLLDELCMLLWLHPFKREEIWHFEWVLQLRISFGFFSWSYFVEICGMLIWLGFSIGLEDLVAFLRCWFCWIIIFLKAVNFSLSLSLKLVLNVLECPKPLVVLSFGWSTNPFDLRILSRRQLDDILFAIGITTTYFIDFKFISNVENNQRLVVFLLLIHIELGPLKGKVPLHPVCILGKHELEVVDGFVLPHFQKPSKILWFKLFLYVFPLASLYIIKAEPHRWCIYNHWELPILLKYDFIFFLLGIVHDEVSE